MWSNLCRVTGTPVAGSCCWQELKRCLEVRIPPKRTHFSSRLNCSRKKVCIPGISGGRASQCMIPQEHNCSNQEYKLFSQQFCLYSHSKAIYQGCYKHFLLQTTKLKTKYNTERSNFGHPLRTRHIRNQGKIYRATPKECYRRRCNRDSYADQFKIKPNRLHQIL